jgi:hypothetical protein
MGYELKAARARAQANHDEPLAKQLSNAFKKLDEVHQEILAEILRPTPSIEDARGKCVCLIVSLTHLAVMPNPGLKKSQILLSPRTPTSGRRRC